MTIPLLLLASLAAPATATNYSRREATYIIQYGGNAYHVADRLGDWTPEQLELVAKEIATLNKCNLGDRHGQGAKLRVPAYEPSKRHFSGDLRNWLYAVRAAEAHGVSPALLVAIRSHENPAPAREGYGYGVKAVRWQGLSVQADWAAKIVARVAKRQGWSATAPTRDDVSRLGRAYAEGSRSWGVAVWVLYKRAK